MKTQVILIALLFLFFTSHSAFTQTHARIGIKGGTNFSTFAGDVDDVTLRTSFHAGVFIAVPSAKNLMIQPELLFSSQGTKYEGSNDVTTLNYLSMPIMFKLFPTDGFSIEAGPQFSYLLSSETDYGLLDVDNTNTLKNYDVSAALGVGYQANDVLFNVRYYLGLTDLSENSNDNERFANRTIQVSLGFMF